jgi:transposase
LTEAEASFRALKSELSIRPLFHQLKARVKAHVLVAFLGYALWVTPKHLLKRRAAIVQNRRPAVSLMRTRRTHEFRLRRAVDCYTVNLTIGRPLCDQDGVDETPAVRR